MIYDIFSFLYVTFFFICYFVVYTSKDGWEKRWVKSDWKKDNNTAGEWKHTAGIWSGDANDKGKFQD